VAWHLPEDETLNLPIDALALLILRDYRRDGWNRNNWLLESKQWGSAKSDRSQRALSEGWSFLISRGLVAIDPTKDSSDAYFVTREGEAALKAGIGRLEAAQRLEMSLHPRLAQRVQHQFMLGEYELAVFAATKAVEVRVRELTGFPDDLVGVPLMQEAFSTKKPGPLVDPHAVGSEQEAMLALFKGAIGVFKNPASHRPVEYDDPAIASEVVLFADLLLRMLDSVANRLGRAG
jgi:uncharacterized protein (TIGR02391 family)